MIPALTPIVSVVNCRLPGQRAELMCRLSWHYWGRVAHFNPDLLQHQTKHVQTGCRRRIIRILAKGGGDHWNRYACTSTACTPSSSIILYNPLEPSPIDATANPLQRPLRGKIIIIIAVLIFGVLEDCDTQGVDNNHQSTPVAYPILQAIDYYSLLNDFFLCSVQCAANCQRAFPAFAKGPWMVGCGTWRTKTDRLCNTFSLLPNKNSFFAYA